MVWHKVDTIYLDISANVIDTQKPSAFPPDRISCNVFVFHIFLFGAIRFKQVQDDENKLQVIVVGALMPALITKTYH